MRSSRLRYALFAISIALACVDADISSSAIVRHGRGFGFSYELAADGLLVIHTEVGDKVSLRTTVKGGGIERLDDRGHDLEQSWEFRSPPAGRRGLDVRVAITSSVQPELRADGVDIGAVHYGHGEWVDASGARTRVAATLEGRDIVLRVPEEVVARSAYPAILDPPISAEIILDSTPVRGPSAGVQPTSPVAAASDGTNTLVVWKVANRMLLTGNLPLGGGDRFYATRFGPSGARLDSIPILLPPDDTSPVYTPTTAVSRRVQPRLYFGGGNYLFTYSVRRLSVEPVTYVTRITPAGVVLDPNGILLGEGEFSTFDGTNFFLIGSGGNGAVVTPTGAKLATITLPAPTPNPTQISAASTGAVTFLSWPGFLKTLPAPPTGNLYGIRLSSTGAALDAAPILLDTVSSSFESTTATDGVDFHTVFLATGTSSYRFMVSAANGTVSKRGLNDYGRAGELTFDGTNYVLLANRSSDNAMRAFRFDAAGSAITPAGSLEVDPHLTSNPVATRAPGGSFLFWTERAPPDDFELIRGTRISTSGVIAEPVLADGSGAPVLSVTANEQREPQVAFDGTNYLVVWRDGRAMATRGQNPLLMATRISQTGVVLDSAPIVLPTGLGANLRPTVFFDGAAFLLQWAVTGAAPYYRSLRVTPAGTVVEATPRVSDVGIDAAGAGVYLSTYEDAAHFAMGQRVSKATGIALDPGGFRLAGGAIGLTSERPTAAFAGTDFVAAWTKRPNASSPSEGIYAARITSTGSVGDPVVVSSKGTVDPCVIACDATGLCAIAWRTDAEIRIARVSGAGVLDPEGLPIKTVSPTQPAIVWDGTAFVLTFTDYVRPTAGTTVEFDAVAVVAISLAPDGTFATPQPYAVASRSTFGASSVGSNGKAGALVAYSKQDSDPVFATHRVRAKLIGVIPPAAGTPDAGPPEAGATSPPPGPGGPGAPAPPALAPEADDDSGCAFIPSRAPSSNEGATLLAGVALAAVLVRRRRRPGCIHSPSRDERERRSWPR